MAHLPNKTNFEGRVSARAGVTDTHAADATDEDDDDFFPAD
jgi:hypothetical protein